MADNSFGQAVFRLLLDDKEFRAAFANAVQTAQVSTKKIADLTRVRIDAPDMKSLDESLESGTAKLSDFGTVALETGQEFEKGFKAGVREGLEEMKAGFDNSNPALKRHGAEVDNLKTQYRQFLREQRFQDRVMGEARSGIMSLVTSIGLLSATTSGQTGESGRLNQALLQGIGMMNAMEFMLFSMNTLAARATGSMAGLAAAIGAMSLPISVAVGAGLFLITMLRSTNEESAKAVDQGLSKLDEMLERLTRRQRIQIVVDVEGIVSQAERARAELEAALTTSVVAGAGSSVEVEKELAMRSAQSELLSTILTKLREKIKEEQESSETNRTLIRVLSESTDEYVRQEGRLFAISESLKRNTDMLTGERLTQERITELLDEQARIERQRADRMMSSLDRAKNEVEVARKKFELGTINEAQLRETLERQIAVAKAQGDEKAMLEAQLDLHKLTTQTVQEKLAVLEAERNLGMLTAEEYISALRTVKATVTDRKEQLELEQRISSALKAQTDELVAQAERFRQINEERLKETETARIAAIENRFDREIELENRRFAGETEKIRARLNFVGALTEEQEEQRRRDIETLHNLEVVHSRNIQAIEERRMTSREEASSAAFASETERAIAGIEARYAVLEQKATEAYKNEAERAVVVAELRKRKEEEVQAYLTGVQLEGLNRIAAALGQLGDDAIAKFARMLQIAVQIAQTLERARIGQEGGDPLSIIASFLPLLGLFEEGGEIPSGSYVVKRSRAKENKELLDGVGAVEVTGGAQGKDSVPFKIRGTDGVALLAPGERIVAPKYAFIGRAINEGKIIRRASGGSIGSLYSIVEEFRQMLVNGLDSFPFPTSLVEQIKEALAVNALTLRAFSSMVEELREIREGIMAVSEETSLLRAEASKPIVGEVTFVDGKMFLRRELPEALSFEQERSA